MNSKIVNTKLGPIEYSSNGDGIPILFIYGGHANCHFTLPHKGLGKYHLITPCRPGYGKTPLNNNKSPKDTADLFVALLDSLDIAQVIVYGISAGGWTSLELAANYPDRVKKLLLVSAVTKKWLDENGEIYKVAKKIFHPKIEWFTWNMVRLFSSLAPRFIAKNFLQEFSSIKNPSISKNEIKELINTLKKMRSKEGFLNDINQNIDSGILRRIGCPTLILHSKYDNSVPLEHAEHAKKEIQNSTLQYLENKWGHMIWIGNDYETAHKLIIDFIDEKPAHNTK